MKTSDHFQVGAKVRLANLTDDEADLNGLPGVVTRHHYLDLTCPETGEELRGVLHSVRLDDENHSAQTNGFMDHRIFYRYQMEEIEGEQDV